MQEVGKVLAELMSREHLSGRQLARLAGVNHNVPSSIVNGKLRRPRAEVLKALAKGLATSNSGEFDDAKYREYATRLLEPLDLAPTIKDGEIIGVTDTATCGGCGAQVHRSALFCPSCGRSFSSTTNTS